jgi:tetratricopeptide (TPR) repeat protein
MPTSKPPHRALTQNTLAILLQEQFRRTEDPAILDEAVLAARRAVDATPPGHSHRWKLLNNLAQALQLRSTTGQLHDLDAAIDALNEAVSLAAPGYPAGVATANLSSALVARYEHTQDPGDLDAAVDAGQRAVESLSHDQLKLGAALINLARALRLRAEQPDGRRDQVTAMHLLRRATGMAAAPAELRLEAAHEYGNAARDLGDAGAATDGYAAAVELLPQLAWRGLARSTQEDLLVGWIGLANDAACLAVASGELERAVELLDQGRSVLWSQALHVRSDSARLAERSPELAAELDEIRRELDVPPPSGGLGLGDDHTAAAEGAERRRRSATRWDAVVNHVRTLDGFRDFLAPTPFAALRNAAVDGPVVIVNAGRLGCHALLVTATSPVRAIELTDLTYADAVEQANLLLEVLDRAADPHPDEAEQDRAAVLDLLEWLWSAVARPVLDGLGYTAPLNGATASPRIWWCPTGPLTLLPLHAAGRHARMDAPATAVTETVAGRVVSSYTTTLGALVRARQPVPSRPLRQLVVGLPSTPDLPPLPAVTEELEVLASHLRPPDCALHVVGSAATREAMLTALPDHPWLHLACHASRQPDDPSRSAIALWNGPLTVADLAGLRLEDSEFAFLSACDTAAGSPRLPDEAIHLAAALQLLGYRSVVATLWSIEDSPAPGIADVVYGEILRTDPPDPTRAAAALHHALEQLRADSPEDPLRWAPYIHTGP